MGNLAATNPFSGIDLLADHRSEAYFVMKDALIHYFSLRSKNYRRDFNPEVAAALDAFAVLSKKDRAALHQAFTIGYRKPDATVGRAALSDWRDAILNRTDGARDYFSLLDLSDTKTLRIAYKRCTKINHPDVGGTHEAMVALNEVFNLLLEMISARIELAPNIDGERVNINRDSVTIDMTPIPHSTWCSWLGPLIWGTYSSGVHVYRPVDADYALAILRASIAIDEYELIDSTALFKRIFLQKFGRGKNDWGRKGAMLEASILLCTRLRAARLDAEAIEIAQLVRSSSLTTYFNWAWMARKLNEVMESGARPQVNPLHPRQRANWERSSQQRRTGTAARLLRARRTRETKFRDAVSALGGFLRLPLDPPMPSIPPHTLRQIPQPNSWTPLTTEQIAEYHFIFYQNPTLDLVNKYLTLRCDMWFSALFEADVPVVRLLTEIETVAKFNPQVLRRTPVHQRIESLLSRCTFMDFVDVLLNMLPENARRRLDLLADIDARYGNTARNWIVKNCIQNSHMFSSGMSFLDIDFPDIRDTFYREMPDQLSLGGQLTLNPVLARSFRKEWFKAACAPIGQLEHALETGWMAPRDELIAKAWQRCHDYSITHALTQRLWWETGARYALEEKNDELFISLAEESIKNCLAHMLQTEFTEELYLGWWSDNLARTLLRLGDNAAARRVAICFLELPTRAHAWTTEKEMDFLRRLGRPQP